MRAYAAATAEANAGRIETKNRLERGWMRFIGFVVAMSGVSGVVGAVVLTAWLPLLAGVLLLVAGGLLIWLSTWLPSVLPAPGKATLHRKALWTILGVGAAVLAAALLFSLSARLGVYDDIALSLRGSDSTAAIRITHA